MGSTKKKSMFKFHFCWIVNLLVYKKTYLAFGASSRCLNFVVVSALFYNWNLSEEQSQYLNLGSCRKCLSAFSSCRDKAAFIQFFRRPCIRGSLIHWVNLGIAYKFKLQMSSCVFCSNVTWWSWIRDAERASPLAGVNLRMANPSLDLAIVGALNHWVANFFLVCMHTNLES